MMIDFGGHNATTGVSFFADADIIKPRWGQDDSKDEEQDIATGLDLSRAALSDPADNPNRPFGPPRPPSFRTPS
jgi:hypothetical protein